MSSARTLVLLLGVLPSASLRVPAAGLRCHVATAATPRGAHVRLQEGAKYSQKTRLAEEVASPFAKARSFAWPALFAAASIATYFAGTSLLAETAGQDSRCKAPAPAQRRSSRSAAVPQRGSEAALTGLSAAR